MADGGGTSPGAKAAALGGAQEERGAALPVVSSDAIAASNTELGEEATAMMRRSCWEFIAEVCGLLDMEHDAVEAATQFCHRFYLVQSYHDHDPYVISTACVFLATKVAERRRRLRDVLNCAWAVRYPDSTALELDSAYWSLKMLLVCKEQLVLRELRFATHIESPQPWILNIARVLRLDNSVVQLALALANDALSCELCLTQTPRALAVGAVAAALEVIEAHEGVTLELPRGSFAWWDTLGVPGHVAESVAHALLDIAERAVADVAAASASTRGAPASDAKLTADGGSGAGPRAGEGAGSG